MFPPEKVLKSKTNRRRYCKMKPKNDRNGLAPCLAVLGTGSDVGKSIVTAALCRCFAKLGVRVAPYKSQNMSNNSGVTPEGLEMGRAQIVQAEAAGIVPNVDMNPILLKPTSDVGSQVILLGRARENSTAMAYHRKKDRLFTEAKKALIRLRRRYDLVVMEGAGSCAEVNLMAHDIVNLPMAAYAEAPVILVGDIHRGGIFAQFIGTLGCLSPENNQRIAGFLVNRFRGDIRLFQEGVKWIEERTQKPVFGVLPWYNHFAIESEDSMVIEGPKRVDFKPNGKPAIAIIRLPHISNFTDFDALTTIEALSVYYVEKPQNLSLFAAVIIPGSKNTRFDLNWLKETGWEALLKDYLQNNGHLTGICGGYQMMGESVCDPDGVEGAPGSTKGLGVLPVKTDLMAPKTTTLTRFTWGEKLGKGYEIHMGQTKRLNGRALLTVQDRNGRAIDDDEGCYGDNGRCMGTYMHGFFDTHAITARWLAEIGLTDIRLPQNFGWAAKDKAYELLSEHFEAHVNVKAVADLLI
jgi:adenosylcobyric acid synthase